MHNGAYDTKIVYNNLRVDLLPCLYADTQLMRHTVKEEGPFALKDIAVELQMEIGIDSTEVANQDQIDLEANVIAKGGSWKKSNKEIYKADLPILAKYAACDTDLTLRLFHHFEKELEKENLTKFFYEDEVMPLYTHVTIPMEFEGIYMDMPKLIKNNTEIEQDISEAKSFVTLSILSSEAGKEFVSRKLAEYLPSNKGSFAQELCKYLKLDFPISESGKYSITAKSLKANPNPFLISNNPNDLEENVIKAVQLELYKKDEPCLFNIGSKQQLCELVFDILEVEPTSKTDKGSPQFNEALLESLEFDWARELRIYNKLTKIQGSYYSRFLEYNEDGIFYPTFKQFGTTSGRYGSDMQQLSRPLEQGSDDDRIVKYTNTLRELFIPKPDHAFIDDDYESLEPRIFSDDAAEQALIDIFELGEDFYSKVAIQAEGLKNVSADKKHPDFFNSLDSCDFTQGIDSRKTERLKPLFFRIKPTAA